MATETRDAATEDKGKPAKRKRTSPILFIRQVVGELRKVIWPTRKELINYTVISMVFVLVMIGIVSLFDWGLTKGILALFG
ncbi:preprotein translocase subunit SecE [Actinocorallia longicatena]|uniref:Protein translocase subunit SecE n=1 Tax=Actinocorallia longicatena TaxID=111803 RepID=A0ABP6QG30_9ACTN